MRNFIHLFAKQKIMGNNALALLVLFLATREIVSRFPYGSPKCLHFGIGCANLAKGRSVLARELLDKFSSQSEPSRVFSITPSGVFLLSKIRMRCILIFYFHSQPPCSIYLARRSRAYVSLSYAIISVQFAQS